MKILSYLVLLVFFAAACKSSEPPKDTKEEAQKAADAKVNEFFVALEKQDFTKAKTLATPATQKILDLVVEDAKKYKEFNNKPQPIKIEVLERTFADKAADYKVRILVGEKAREEKIHLVLDKDIWLLDIAEPQITLFRYVVFFDTYDAIIVIYTKKYPHKKIIEIKKSKKKSKKKTKKHR